MVWEAPRWAVFQGWGAPWAVAACKADGSARPPRPPRPRAEGRRLGTMCFVFLSSGTSVCPFAGELREGRGRPAGTRWGGPWLLPGAGLPLRVAAPRVLTARLRRPGPRHRGARGRRGRCPALAGPDRLSVHPRQEHNVFYGHHAKIVCLAWSPDNEHFASGGMDMMVYVWTLSDPETRVKIQGDSRTRLSRPRSSSEAAPRHWPPASSVGALLLGRPPQARPPDPGLCWPQSLSAVAPTHRTAPRQGPLSPRLPARAAVTEADGGGGGGRGLKSRRE